MTFRTKRELETLWECLHHAIERECVYEEMTVAELRTAVAELRRYTTTRR